MRGCKNGLEARLREKAPHLLDIDGDTCHHIHNASKELCKPFKRHAESLFSDLHTDFKFSTDLRDALAEVCETMGMTFTMLQRFISHRYITILKIVQPSTFPHHRWLSCYDLAVETLNMIDALTVFYSAFLPVTEVATYEDVKVHIYKKRGLSWAARFAYHIYYTFFISEYSCLNF
mgnify:CR=1 FL=1